MEVSPTLSAQERAGQEDWELKAVTLSTKEDPA